MVFFCSFVWIKNIFSSIFEIFAISDNWSCIQVYKSRMRIKYISPKVNLLSVHNDARKHQRTIKFQVCHKARLDLSSPNIGLFLTYLELPGERSLGEMTYWWLIPCADTRWRLNRSNLAPTIRARIQDWKSGGGLVSWNGGYAYWSLGTHFVEYKSEFEGDRQLGYKFIR